MNTYFAVVKKETLGFGSEKVKDSVVCVRETNGRQTPIVNEQGNHSKELEMFDGHLCKIIGEMKDFLLYAKMIESCDDPELSWSV